MDVSQPVAEELPPQFARLAYRTLEKRAATGEVKEHWMSLYEQGVRNGNLLPVDELFTARYISLQNWVGIIQLGLDPDVLGQGFSLLHALECKIEAMGMISAVMMTAQNPRAHLTVLEAYGPVLEPNSNMSVGACQGGMYLTVNYPHIHGDVGRVFCEAGVAMWEDYLDRVTGYQGHVKQELTFHYSAPPNAAKVNEAFWSDVHFDQHLSIGASGWTVEIPDELLDTPNPHYNIITNQAATEALLQLVEYKARKKAEALGTDTPYTYQAREAMMGAVAIPSQAKIAGFQGVTPRALQNRLKAEGTTYQEIRDDVEIEKCKALLLGGKSVPQIAATLGVASESLHRKFKKVTGVTPKTFYANSRIGTK